MNFISMNYGDDPSQFVELISDLERNEVIPEAIVKVAVLIHGGFWRGVYDLTLMNDLGVFLSKRVDLIFNVEYRRLTGGGGWPTTFDDVVSAVRLIMANLEDRRGESTTFKVFFVGHSAGGHLASLANSYFTGLNLDGFDFYGISLGGVLDLEIGFDDHIGDGVVGQFLAITDRPTLELLSQASPRHRLSGDETGLVVTGGKDLVVPLSIAESFVQRAREVGANIEYVDFANEDHMDLIGTSSKSIEAVVDYIGRQ
ncbi:MAG: alpha/beta hydrolase [Actinomycetota bacterium]|nr:alpha/beta hydrolase [Actinomycetota bacterium]